MTAKQLLKELETYTKWCEGVFKEIEPVCTKKEIADNQKYADGMYRLLLHAQMYCDEHENKEIERMAEYYEENV